MIELVVDNSYSQVKGLNLKQFTALRDLLSYQIDAKASYFSGGFRPRKRFLVDAKGNFPTGLATRVASFLLMSKIDFSIKDSRIKPIPNLGNSYPKWVGDHYKAQEDALLAAADTGRGCISMPTGTGKSRVIAMIINTLAVKTLVVVPTLGIKTQLINDLQAIYGDLRGITVENIDSPALKAPGGYDCLIIDEAHHVAAKTYHKLNRTAWKGIYYRFFMTATPFRNQNEEQLLFEGIAGDVIYQLSYKQAIKEGYIVPVEAYYLEMPKTANDCYTWAETYSQLVVKNAARNDLIAYLAVKLNSLNRSTLVLVKEIAHGTVLAVKTGLHFANGQDSNSEQLIKDFNSGKIKTLIGTEGILGEGIDTKPCEYVIIAGLGKAKSAFMQKVGRAVRRYEGKESAKVIIIKDPSHKFTLRHFKEQCKILKEEYGVVPQKLDL